MVTKLERLIEAVEFSKENGQEWYEIFDSFEEAEEIISGADEEDVDEYQIATLIALYDDEEDFYDDNLEQAFRQYIRKMKKQVKKAIRNK